MRKPETIRCFEARLAELGCSVTQIRRQSREMTEHHEDLKRAALESGLRDAEAEAHADQLLGEPIALAEHAALMLRKSSWWGRHPIIAFCLLPPIGIIATSIATIFLSWGLCNAYFTPEEWKVVLTEHGASFDLIADSFKGAYFVAIGLMAMLFCWLARRSVSGFKWALIACGICSLHSFFFQLWVAPTYVAAGYYMHPNWIGAVIPLLVALAAFRLQRRARKRLNLALVCIAFFSLCTASAEETGVRVVPANVPGDQDANPTLAFRRVPSIFSPDLSPIPTTLEEMLPRYTRAGDQGSTPYGANAARDGSTVTFALDVSAPVGDLSSSMDEVHWEMLYRRVEERGYLTRPDRPSDNRFVRSMDAIFSPEVIRIGGTAVTFSLYTAIKRKNPLCLLNPLVVGVSW